VLVYEIVDKIPHARSALLKPMSSIFKARFRIDIWYNWAAAHKAREADRLSNCYSSELRARKVFVFSGYSLPDENCTKAVLVRLSVFDHSDY